MKEELIVVPLFIILVAIVLAMFNMDWIAIILAIIAYIWMMVVIVITAIETYER